MRRQEIVELLKQRPGYEAVYLLLDSDRQRREIAEYTNRDGGTLQRWLDDAIEAGLIEKEAVLRDGNSQVRYSLACEIPDDLHDVIEQRGGHGPRNQRSNFADSIAAHVWRDPYSLDLE
jgi:hypothetical protein